MVAQADVLTRDQVRLEDTWDLTPIYQDDAAWDADAARIESLLAAATAHRGRLGDSAPKLADALDAAMEARRIAERLQVYASLRRDENTADDGAAARYERAFAISLKTAEALAFVRPETLAIPAARLDRLIADPALAPYRHLLDNLARHRAHVRSVEVEEVLAQTGEITRGPRDAFTALDNADLTYGLVRDDTGAEITLTKARYRLLLESKNREVRQSAFDTLANAYLAHQHTLASLHGASVRKDVMQAKVRGFAAARQAALFNDNIPEAVYDNLVEAVRAARPTLERAMALRRRVLGLDQLELYDLTVPLSAEPERRYDYREAVEIVLGGLHSLGERYVADLASGFNSRWVDVHETKGKRSGAYSSGVYGAPPVILMNWNGTLDDTFTLAHEAGHAVHSLYADASQPYHDADYSIFLAEIASTVNETLLTWHLLDTTDPSDTAARFALLDRFTDGFYGTVIRQTMLAEFEARTHAAVEAGRPLTLATLNTLYGDLFAAYAPAVAIDDRVRVQWSRVPHFYRGFYVYQYATGLSAAITLARAIRDEGEPAATRYLAMLAAGASDYPLTVLQRAGVDLTTPAPIQIALAEYDRVIAEMERLAADRRPTTDDR